MPWTNVIPPLIDIAKIFRTQEMSDDKWFSEDPLFPEHSWRGWESNTVCWNFPQLLMIFPWNPAAFSIVGHVWLPKGIARGRLTQDVHEHWYILPCCCPVAMASIFSDIYKGDQCAESKSDLSQTCQLKFLRISDSAKVCLGHQLHPVVHVSQLRSPCRTCARLQIFDIPFFVTRVMIVGQTYLAVPCIRWIKKVSCYCCFVSMFSWSSATCLWVPDSCLVALVLIYAFSLARIRRSPEVGKKLGKLGGTGGNAQETHRCLQSALLPVWTMFFPSKVNQLILGALNYYSYNTHIRYNMHMTYLMQCISFPLLFPPLFPNFPS